MDAPPPPRPFRIDTSTTPAVVEVDGVDVAPVIRGATVHVGCGQETRLILEETRPGTLSATGAIQVAGTRPAPADAVRALDPQAVEELAMTMDLDGVMATNYLAAVVELIEAA